MSRWDHMVGKKPSMIMMTQIGLEVGLCSAPSTSHPACCSCSTRFRIAIAYAVSAFPWRRGWIIIRLDKACSKVSFRHGYGAFEQEAACPSRKRAR